MNLKKRIKTLGLAVVMTTGLFLSSLLATVNAVTTMNDIYYDAKQASVGDSTYKTALAKNKTLSANTNTIPKEYTYMLAPTEATTVTVNKIGQSTVDKGVASASAAYKQWWKLQDSWKGNIKATFTHCGFYQGKEINVVMTLLDWEFLDNNQARNNTVDNTSDDAKNVYVSFPAKNLTQGVNTGVNKIGIEVEYCSWIKVRYNFYDQNGSTVNVKGFTTFNDIDGGQGVHYISGHRNLYSTYDSKLYYSEVNGTPYIFDKDNSSSNNEDKPYWITNTFNSSMTVAYTFGMNSRATSNTLYPGLGYFVRGGCGWITNYEEKAVKSATAAPVKTVSTNLITNRDKTFTYTITHTVPYESEDNHYNSYSIVDDIPDELELMSTQVFCGESDVTRYFSMVKGNNTIAAIARNIDLKGFYNSTYKLVLTVKLKDDVDVSKPFEIKNKGYIQINGTKTYSNEVATLVNIVSSSINKQINSKNEYTLHHEGEEITYTGSAIIQNQSSVESIVISDKLDSNLKFKTMVISHNENDITDWGSVEYNEEINTVQFVFNSSAPSFAGEKIDYQIICEYTGSFDNDKEIPNIISLVINNETIDSNEVKLYIPGVNAPQKSIDKSEISEKTETVTYTVTNTVDSKTSEYFYDSFVITDTLESILEFKSARVLDNKGTDVSNLFNISENGNLVTASAKETKTESFYGHTYKLEIKANIKTNANLSSYSNSSGKATIPNTSTLTVDNKDYKSNTVNFCYQTKSDSIDKTILSDNKKVSSAKLLGNQVVYTGNAVIGDKTEVSSVVISDMLNSDLKYVSIALSLESKNITDWGNIQYNKDNNTIRFEFNSEKLASVSGKTIEYTINCEHTGKLSEQDKEIPNTISLVVNGKATNSNEVKLFVLGVNPPVKSIDKSEISEKTETVTYTISSVVDRKKAEYFYNSYALSDRLEDVLKVKSIKMINEDNKDITDLFDVSQKDNLVTATAKNTNVESFYGHTYKLVIEACIKDKNTDISSYCDDKGKATIPNTSTLIIDGNSLESNAVTFNYQTKASSINKYIIADGEKVTKAKLNGDKVTYTGKAVVQDSKSVKSVMLSDKLNKDLEYENLSLKLKDKDITDWGNAHYNKDNNTINYAFSSDKLGDVIGQEIEYTLNCEYKGKNPQDISNVIDLLVDNKPVKSNDTLLTTISEKTTSNNKTINENINSQPNTGSDERKAPIILFVGVLGVAFGVVVYRFRKIKKENKEDK